MHARSKATKAALLNVTSIMHAASKAAKANAQQLANFTCVHHHPRFPALYPRNNLTQTLALLAVSLQPPAKSSARPRATAEASAADTFDDGHRLLKPIRWPASQVPTSRAPSSCFFREERKRDRTNQEHSLLFACQVDKKTVNYVMSRLELPEH